MDVVALFAAFSAGLLSFLSPCVLPLIPSYVTFLTGLSLEDAQNARRTALVHATLFVAGFTMLFMALGAGATALGGLMFEYRDWISRIGGALLVVFGLYLLGVFNIAFFAREWRVHLSDKPVGYLGSLFVGITFAAGWSPCIGPILTSILAFTASAADFNKGMTLLFAYSMGLAIPFLLAAVLLQRFLAFFARAKSVMAWVSRIAGALLVIVGVMMMTNYFTLLASMMSSLTPEFIKSRL